MAVLVAASLDVGHAWTTADPVQLTGCVVKADDGDGYLLINAPREAADSLNEPHRSAPTTVGTTPVFANIFYWLENDNDLKRHIGHQVAIEGELKGDLRDGQLKIDRKDNWTEIKVEADGHDMKARVPNASVLPGPDPDRKLSVLVRRVDVKKVRMLDAACR
jgi:hypothetical protein